MTALSIMRLLPDGGLIADGSVRFDRRDILALPEVEMRGVRGGAMGMIFQEPATSLNPVLTVGRQIIEVLDRHSILSGVEARRRASQRDYRELNQSTAHRPWQAQDGARDGA